ncbi:MAG: V-type ATP synthase subunit F [Oscillospiraceae bacterium]|nr:V-type ATP synthase subunit F [Oscillospiraceae bacterium]
MKFLLISDNHDTITGMRLAGIEGIITHDAEGVGAALSSAINDGGVGIILITEKLVKLCPELVYDLKLNRMRPLIVEIPDRHSSGRAEDSITRYIREAIGVKI